MKKQLITRWFLGANSSRGFKSLYDGFATGQGDYLRVIKGGPGGWKSGFMRYIGEAAEEKGMDVCYILCSGDPGSLDGVYIPELRLGYVDGTAPHIIDPEVFGASGDYLNLGALCHTENTRNQRSELNSVTAAYRACYDRAYTYLGAASRANPARNGAFLQPEDAEAARRRAWRIAERELPRSKRDTLPGGVSRLFLSATTCQGEILLEDTLTALCERVWLADDRLGMGDVFLRTLLAESLSRGVDAIACPRPDEPSRLQALILPALSIGFVAAAPDTELSFEPHRRLRLDSALERSRLRELRPRLRTDEKLEIQLKAAAVDALAEAKALHDELERIYNPNVNFDELRELAEKEAKKIGIN